MKVVRSWYCLPFFSASSNFKFVPGTRLVRRAGSPSNSSPTDVDEEVDVAAAVEAAKASDVVVLCLGEGSYTEHPGSIADLTLPEMQLQFAERLIATGKPRRFGSFARPSVSDQPDRG